MENEDIKHAEAEGRHWIYGRIHYLEIIKGGTRLAIPKTIWVPNTSLMKTSSGATEGVLD